MNEDFEAVIYRGTAIAELADIFIKKDISTKEQGAELLTEWFEGLKGGVQKNINLPQMFKNLMKCFRRMTVVLHSNPYFFKDYQIFCKNSII